MGLWWQLPRAAAAHSSGGQNWTQDLLPGLEEVGQVCRRELSQGAISAPVPRTLQSPRPGSPITLPTWTPSPGVGMGRATDPTLTVPLFSPEVLMSSMEEEVASVRARQSVLDLFRVPVLCWRSLSLFVVQYAIPVILPGDGAGEGGGPMGKTVPTGLVGCISGRDRQPPQEAGVLAGGREGGCADMAWRGRLLQEARRGTGNG